MSNKKPYYGAARFVEIMPPGIPFRSIANVDHITQITFGEKREDIPTPVPEGEEPPDIAVMENHLTGFTVSVGVGGANSEFTFIDLKTAMRFYNELTSGIHSLVPCNLYPPMQPPPELDAPMSDAELDALAEDIIEVDEPLPETEH